MEKFDDEKNVIQWECRSHKIILQLQIELKVG